ncbi:MAG: vanadium-dependent haloperoxidase [Bosea sp. (in: a-proteobacteria)]
MPNLYDPVVFWSDVALEAHRRDFTFTDAIGRDEAGLGRTSLSPVQGGPTRVSRAFAIIHTAMYDALFRADPETFRKDNEAFAALVCYQSTLPPPPAGLNRAAAVAGAAAVCIRVLFKNDRDGLVEDKLTAFRLSLMQNSVTADSIELGLDFGARVGRQLLDARANDGSEKPDAMYRPLGLAGTFDFDPFGPKANAVGPTWGDDVSLFGGYLKASVAFVSPVEALGGVPAANPEGYSEFLKAPGWAADRDKVRTLGAAPATEGLARTPEQTVIGVFWGYDGARGLGVPPRLYNQCLHAIIKQLGLSTEAAALLLAAANIGMADAGILAWKEKYQYQVGRPATVLRAIEDGYAPRDSTSPPTFDPAALGMPAGGNVGDYPAMKAWLSAQPTNESVKVSDPGWACFGAPQTNSSALGAVGRKSRTPQFPAYPSGHATFGSVCFGITSEILAAIGKDANATFEFVSDEFDGAAIDESGSRRVRHNRSMTLAQAIHENAVSRVYLGVHWEIDAIEGVRLGRAIIDALRSAPIGPLKILPPNIA